MDKQLKIDAGVCAERLRAVADGERLRIVCLLKDGPKTVGDIATAVGSNIVNASHHLQVLKHAHLVRAERRGRHIFYQLAEEVAALDNRELDFGCCKLRLEHDNIS